MSCDSVVFRNEALLSICGEIPIVLGTPWVLLELHETPLAVAQLVVTQTWYLKLGLVVRDGQLVSISLII